MKPWYHHPGRAAELAEKKEMRRSLGAHTHSGPSRAGISTARWPTPIGLRSGDPGATIPGASGQFMGDFPRWKTREEHDLCRRSRCFTGLETGGPRWR